MTMSRMLRLLPPGFQIVLADVGSAGGLKSRWREARSVVSALLFDPRDDGAPAKKGRDTYFPVGLGKTAGRATLNITELGNMSSMLPPNVELLKTFRKKGAHTKIVSTWEMPIDTLDNIAHREGILVDVLKVDTQGTELDILQGAEKCLASSVFMAEIEVSFLERYKGQPFSDDIIAFMRARGFDLIDLYRLKRYRHLNHGGVGNIGLGGGQRAGRLAYGDAIFLLREELLLERIRTLSRLDAQGLALKVMVALLVYGKADTASRLFDLSADLFDEKIRQELTRFFRNLGRSYAFFGGKGLHLILDYLARKV